MGPVPRRWIAWCSPLAFLAAVGLGAWIVFARPFALFTGVVLALAAVPVIWVMVSALWPARAERGCPRCGRDSVRRLDPRAVHGLACDACGWRDESASAWLLAEEEGPLEELVLAERGGAAPAAGLGAVDSPRRRG
jgi:hypothetical protein